MIVFNFTANNIQYTISAPLYVESTQADLINLKLQTPPADFSGFNAQATERLEGQIILTGVFDA